MWSEDSTVAYATKHEIKFKIKKNDPKKIFVWGLEPR